MMARWMRMRVFPTIGTLALILSNAWNSTAADRVTVIPEPNSVKLAGGEVSVAAGLKLSGPEGVTSVVAGEFAARGVKADASSGLSVRMSVARDEVGPAGCYELSVATGGIVLNAADEAGLFYGCQTLLWMLDGSKDGHTLPLVEIHDAPRYPWRGFMLDESRHFFGKAEVKKLLDEMALLKMNRLHWHLTDEPGWRIEIKKYPKLATEGGRGTWSNSKVPAQFYTQDDIREIVAYASARHIMIVPEIDMPGHATAAMRAYPAYSAGGSGKWNGFTFNPADEKTYAFLEDVLTEVAKLFPGPYIHVGGDEVHYGNQTWSTDPKIVAFTKEKGLKNAAELEQYFMRRIADIVQKKLGKTLVGWDEISGAGVDTKKTVPMWWHHEKPQILDQVIAAGFPVILAPRHPLYFDFVQHDSHKVGRRWNGFNDLGRVYDFPEPLQAQLAKAKPGQVLGVNACLWTERIADTKRLGFMIFPRIAATAESGWTQTEAKDKADFMERVKFYLRHLDKVGMPYFNPFDPAKTPEPGGPDKPDVLSNG